MCVCVWKMIVLMLQCLSLPSKFFYTCQDATKETHAVESINRYRFYCLMECVELEGCCKMSSVKANCSSELPTCWKGAVQRNSEDY